MSWYYIEVTHHVSTTATVTLVVSVAFYAPGVCGESSSPSLDYTARCSIDIVDQYTRCMLSVTTQIINNTDY